MRETLSKSLHLEVRVPAVCLLHDLCLSNHVIIDLEEVHKFLVFIHAGGLIRGEPHLTINDEVVLMEARREVLNASK